VVFTAKSRVGLFNILTNFVVVLPHGRLRRQPHTLLLDQCHIGCLLLPLAFLLAHSLDVLFVLSFAQILIFEKLLICLEPP
jgi:hypothetical protein